jgi:hypothetical protein
LLVPGHLPVPNITSTAREIAEDAEDARGCLELDGKDAATLNWPIIDSNDWMGGTGKHP